MLIERRDEDLMVDSRVIPRHLDVAVSILIEPADERFAANAFDIEERLALDVFDIGVAAIYEARSV